MKTTRRQAIRTAITSGSIAFLKFTPLAWADNKRHALYGKFHVRCPNKHVDIVTDGTKQHKCEKCGKQCFVDQKVTLVCPAQHDNIVDLSGVDVLKTYKCKHKEADKVCNKECQGW